MSREIAMDPMHLSEKLLVFLEELLFLGHGQKRINQHSLLFGKLGPVVVSDIVKGAIARSISRSLKSTHGVLTNGETSLRQNQNLSWTRENHS
jgi:hypothetical protein